MDFILSFFKLIPLVIVDYLGSDGLGVLVVGSFFLFVIFCLVLSLKMSKTPRTDEKNGSS